MVRARKTTGRSWLVAGVFVFLIVKLAWVVTPAYFMGIPRLGDDAITYLWTGMNNAVTGRSESRAVATVKEVYQRYSAGGEKQEFERQRVAMRVVGSANSPMYIGLGLTLDMGLDPRLTFAIFESIVALVLALGIVLLGIRLFSYEAIAVGLAVLAVTFFPGQGIHFLIPAVLSLAISFILLREVTCLEPRLSIVFLLSYAAQSVHPIGLIYAVIACQFVILLALLRSERNFSRALWLIASIVCGIGVSRLLEIAPWTDPEISVALGSLDLSSIPDNFLGFCDQLAWAINDMRDPLLVGWLLLIIGAMASIPGRLHQRDPAIVLLVLFAGALVAGFAYSLPGYPGDLSVRLLVPVGIMIAFIGSQFWLDKMPSSTGRAIVAFAAIIAFSASVGRVTKLAFGNAHGRNQVLQSTELRRQFSSLPGASNILYADTDIALIGALLHGGEAYGAIAYKALPKTIALDRLPGHLKPTHLAAMPPWQLNSFARLRLNTFAKRFLGFQLNHLSEISLQLPEGSRKIHLRLSGDTTQLKTVVRSSLGSTCRTRKRVSKSSSSMLIEWPACASGTKTLVLSSKSAIRLVGMTTQDLRDGLNWPWGQSVRLSAKSIEGGAPIVVNFDWEAVVKANLASGLIRRLERQPRAISDAGGIIIGEL